MIGIHRKLQSIISKKKKKKMPSNQETTIKMHKLLISLLSSRENERDVSRKAEVTN